MLTGTFIYPNGATLSSKDIPPSFFTFVFTDTNGVKLYGGVLHIYELLNPSEVRDMLNYVPTSSKFVYVPKALVVLSHYPFFHLFYNILKQLYRISLCSCPLAMEKYVSQVIQETPLPPQGCTRVVFPVADCVFTVSRPPRNQLPMIDFSFRPLFTCLSVNNILTVFSFICAEHKICFASKYLSILTPIQEGFMSFLFPLVWQGAYIPILPAKMLDLLDAPVPMFLGVERCHIFDGKKLIPQYGSGTIIVDVDNDKVLVGCDDFGNSLEPMNMPSKDLAKLKDKLVEFGGCIHKKRNFEQQVEDTLKAFPHNEHLEAIKTFVSLDNGVKIPFLKEKEHDRGVSVQSSYFFKDSKQSIVTSLLSPDSNTSHGIGVTDSFNAKEIRRAFLRFFVSTLRDMHSENMAKMESEKDKKMTKFMSQL